MLGEDQIVVQASSHPRTTFFAMAAAGLKTGDTVIIAPNTFQGPQSILALIEAVSYEFTAEESLGVTRGILTILAGLRADKIDPAIRHCPTFVGTISAAGTELRRAYYSEVDPVRDPKSGEWFSPAPLQVGVLLGEEPVDVVFSSAGFSRHTVMLAQSGSGKSYALGVLLEELVSKTKLRLVVADPNGDFRGLAAMGAVVATGRDPALYTDATRTAVTASERAVIFDLDPLDQLFWSKVMLGLVEGLWETRDQRVPTLLVIDEAHNFAGIAEMSKTDRLRDLLVRIAAEGRKFGLCLLLATQRPQRLDGNIISQCDNLILLKLSNGFDVDHVASSFGAVARHMIDLAIGFPTGTAFAAGRIVKAPTLLRFRQRRTVEGGGDLPLDWCRRQ